MSKDFRVSVYVGRILALTFLDPVSWDFLLVLILSRILLNQQKFLRYAQILTFCLRHLHSFHYHNNWSFDEHFTGGGFFYTTGLSGLLRAQKVCTRKGS